MEEKNWQRRGESKERNFWQKPKRGGKTEGVGGLKSKEMNVN